MTEKPGAALGFTASGDGPMQALAVTPKNVYVVSRIAKRLFTVTKLERPRP